MESGEIRKNTRLNIYSDEEAQVRIFKADSKRKQDTLSRPYNLAKSVVISVSHGY